MNTNARIWSLGVMVFALVGCDQQPHVGTIVGAVDATCADCHTGAYDRAAFDHQSVNYGLGCEECHLETTWTPQNEVGHDRFFPLIGAHSSQKCADCHAEGRADPQPTDCVGCHRTDAIDIDPDHTNFGDDCSVCHTSDRWAPAAFDHDVVYPLLGAHSRTDCGSCHIDGVFQGTPRDCIGCHVEDRREADADDPEHRTFPDSCEVCHSQEAWEPTDFSGHDAYYPLIGRHADRDVAPCGSCHVNDVYAGTPRECEDCHIEDSRNIEPEHETLPPQCAECHTPIGWPQTTFDHDVHWTLDGAHVAPEVNCASCHPGGRYEGTPNQCVDCHVDDRERAVEPDHATLPQTCDSCHTTTGWTPAGLDHDLFWPLEGGHAEPDVQCGDCHIDGVYRGTPRECVACHAEDRDRAVPDHTNFPNDCAECHSVFTFENAQFDHNVFFRLEGAHADPDEVQCNDCHINGVYAGTPRECIGCHLDDKNGAQPTHARFSNDCTECHTQNDFEPAFHRHRQFIVPHEDVSRCTDCHTNPADYALVGCTSCHEHSRGNTDGEHDGVRNYRYADAACLECHPQGRE